MELHESDYELIESLSEQGYSAKGIALNLDVDVALFLVYCFDNTHPIGRAYQRGKLDIERKKNNALMDTVLKSETAIALHDKKLEVQRFIDVKNDIFSPIIIDE